MNYKVLTLTIAAAASAIIFCFGFMVKTKEVQQATGIESKGFAVVELFTSEGCSSCPSADEAIAELLGKNISNTYILAYHVDYWNRLGWKDEFSKPAFSARQQQYATYLSLDRIYTPQAIVNGMYEFVGSNENQLSKTVKNSLQNSGQSNVSITAQKIKNTVVVNYNIAESDAIIFNAALVQPDASTIVKRGENGGRTLKHQLFRE